MAEVFICYSVEDQEFVRQVHEALARLGRDTWIDWRGIPDIARWRAEILAGIEAAGNFVFVISPDSAASRMRREEVAQRRRKTTSDLSRSSIGERDAFRAVAGIVRDRD